MTIDEIKVYINDHRYFSLEEGSKISVSIKCLRKVLVMSSKLNISFIDENESFYYLDSYDLSYFDKLTDIHSQINEIQNNYQLVSNNISLLENTTDDTIQTIASLLNINLTSSKIKDYICSHRANNILDGGKITILYRVI